MSLGRVAIIGTGIAGMSAAHFLRGSCDPVLFESQNRIGGHTHTVEVDGVAFDTGFMVYNEVTYPLLTRLFLELGVPTQPTAMSFSVQVSSSGLEYSGSSLNHLFAQRRNLLNPWFWRLLLRINRFNSEAASLLREIDGDAGGSALTLRQFVDRHGFGEDFLEQFLVPMSSAVWSTPKDRMMAFPAHTLVRFFHNHGFLGLHTQHPWRTVTGGSRSYRDRLVAPFRDRIRAGDPVVSLRRTAGGTEIAMKSGHREVFDRVILACHADEALALLADPTDLERRLLSKFEYQSNPTVVHTDCSVMPRKKLAWSSWNYRIDSDHGASTHYWMNLLQSLPGETQYFVSLNDPGTIDPSLIRMKLDYTHPLFSLEAVAAQAELPALNLVGASTGRHFCGSYFKYGFHEDALGSSVQLCRQLLGREVLA